MLSDRDYMRPGQQHRPWLRPQGSVIKPLLWANVIVFLLTGFGSAEAGVAGQFFEQLHLHPYYMRNWEIWRLGTYMFVHGGFMHILFNMWGLWLFGRVVEARLGPSRFLRLYFICGLVGGLAWLAANWDPQGLYDIVQDGVRVPRAWTSPSELMAHGDIEVRHAYGGVVGASGAVFGILLAAAMTAPDLRIMLLFPPIPMKLRTFVAVYAGIEVFLTWSAATGRTSSRIAHLAHLGGMIGAFFYMRHLGHHGPMEMLKRWWTKQRYKKKRKHFRKVVQDSSSATRHNDSAEIDRILDKIGRQGMGSLTPDERQKLLDAGRRFKGKS